MELAEFVPNQGPGGYQRIYIDHKQGGFKFSGDHEPVDKVSIVPLGLVKQRRLWLEKDNGAKCGCKSPDASNGRPTHIFPEDTYRLTHPTIDVKEQMPACETCPFAKWDARPYKCQEKWYVPVLMWESVFSHHDNGAEVFQRYLDNTVYIMEFSQSAIKHLREWFKKMLGEGRKPWEITSDISTKKLINGNSTFMIPVMKDVVDTGAGLDDEYYVQLFREVRDMLTKDAMRGSIYDTPAPKDKFDPIDMGN